MKTAILIDGGFFIRRYKYIKGFSQTDTPQVMAKNIFLYCTRHIRRINNFRNRYGLPPTELYRIFYYDAKPFEGDSQNPISKKSISFKKTPQFKFRNNLFEELKKQRKIALRLGFLKNSSREWAIKSKHTKGLINGDIKIKDLTDFDLEFPLK